MVLSMMAVIDSITHGGCEDAVVVAGNGNIIEAIKNCGTV